jgi:hypothetical protein
MREINEETSKYAFLLGWVMELEPGKAHKARRGKEFTCEPSSFGQVVYAAAAQRGYKATVATFAEGVVFAFYRADNFMKPNLAAYPIVKRMRRF